MENVCFAMRISISRNRKFLCGVVLLSVVSLVIVGVYLYKPRVSKQLFAMDTVINIDLVGKDAVKASNEIVSMVNKLSEILDDYSSLSEISQINKNAGVRDVAISYETFEILNEAKRYCGVTDGRFNIMMGVVSKLWGFKDGNYRKPSVGELKDVIELINIDDLELTKTTAFLKKYGEYIDVGGIAKGYALDKISSILRGLRIDYALVNFGGSVLTYGDREWKIGIRNPRGEGVIGVITVKGESFVSTSGDYERFFVLDGKRYCHIFDPQTCSPADQIQSVTVIGRSGVETDALSTAFFVQGTGCVELADRLGVAVIGVDRESSIFGNKEGLSVFEER